MVMAWGDCCGDGDRKSNWCREVPSSRPVETIEQRPEAESPVARAGSVDRGAGGAGG